MLMLVPDVDRRAVHGAIAWSVVGLKRDAVPDLAYRPAATWRITVGIDGIDIARRPQAGALSPPRRNPAVGQLAIPPRILR